MKCQILFLLKNKKNIINLSSAENAQRVIKVKWQTVQTMIRICSSHMPLFCQELWCMKFLDNYCINPILATHVYGHLQLLTMNKSNYRIYLQYWDTLSTYHICPKIWNSLFYYLLMCLKILLYLRQTMLTMIRVCSLWCLIRVYTVCKGLSDQILRVITVLIDDWILLDVWLTVWTHPQASDLGLHCLLRCLNS